MNETNEIKLALNSLLNDLAVETTQTFFEVQRRNPATKGWAHIKRIDFFPNINLSEELHKIGDGKYRLTLFDQDEKKITSIAGRQVRPIVVKVGDDDAISYSYGETDKKEEKPVDLLNELSEETYKEIKLLKLQNMQKQLLKERDSESVGTDKYKELSEQIDKLDEKNDDLVDELRQVQRRGGQQEQAGVVQMLSSIAQQNTAQQQQSQESMFRFLEMMQNQQKTQDEKNQRGQQGESNAMAMMMTAMNKTSSDSQNTMMQMMTAMMATQQEQSKASERQSREMLMTLMPILTKPAPQQDNGMKDLLPLILEAKNESKETLERLLPVLIDSRKEKLFDFKEILAIPGVAAVGQAIFNRFMTPKESTAMEDALPRVMDSVIGTVTTITAKLAEQMMGDKSPEDPLMRKANTALYFLRSITPEIVKVTQSLKRPPAPQQQQQQQQILTPQAPQQQQMPPVHIPVPTNPKSNPISSPVLHHAYPPFYGLDKANAEQYYENTSEDNFVEESLPQDEINKKQAEVVKMIEQVELMSADQAIDEIKTKFPEMLKTIRENNAVTQQMAAFASPKLREVIRRLRRD